MSFIRDNIVKILFGIIALVIIIVIVVACSHRPQTVNTDTGYQEMENKLQSAAIKLTSKNKTLLPKVINDTKKIRISTLIENNYLPEFHAQEDRNVKCTGYVDIIKKYEDQEDYRFTPYIKCGKYYETKTIGEHIIENEPLVTNTQGLVQVEVKKDVQPNEENKDQKYYSYYFKGEYPNNYLVLGERLYRIIEITEDGNLKVISTDRTGGSYIWDNRFNTEKQRYDGINEFDKSRIKQNLEFLYGNTSEDAGEIYFSDLEKEYIVEHDFCVGKRASSDKSISYNSECSVTESMYVGLISIADYYRVSTSKYCDQVGKSECNNYNYLFSLDPGRDITLLTLTGNSDNTYEVYMIYYGQLQTKKASTSKRLFPVIYLDKNIIYKSGDGSAKNPYYVR